MALNNLFNFASILLTGTIRQVDESKAGGQIKIRLVTIIEVQLLALGLLAGPGKAPRH